MRKPVLSVLKVWSGQKWTGSANPGPRDRNTWLVDELIPCLPGLTSKAKIQMTFALPHYSRYFNMSTVTFFVYIFACISGMTTTTLRTMTISWRRWGLTKPVRQGTCPAHPSSCPPPPPPSYRCSPPPPSPPPAPPPPPPTPSAPPPIPPPPRAPHPHPPRPRRTAPLPPWLMRTAAAAMMTASSVSTRFVVAQWCGWSRLSSIPSSLYYRKYLKAGAIRFCWKLILIILYVQNKHTSLAKCTEKASIDTFRESNTY